MIQQPLSTIRCKECSHAVSIREKKCPLCGAPIEKSVQKNALPLQWLLVVPALAILVFLILWRPNTGTIDRTHEPASQQGRSESAGGAQEPTSQRGRSQNTGETRKPTSQQDRSQSAGGTREPAPRQRPQNEAMLPGAAPDVRGQSQAVSTELQRKAVEAFGLGKTHLEKGDYDLAMREFTEAVRLNPNHTEAFTNRGFVYLSKADNDRAIQDFSQAIRLQPNSDLFANRGLAYFNKGDYDHAIQDYDEAIRLSSSDAELFNNRGIAYSSNGNYDRAIQDYDQAVRLNPNYPAVLNNRGWAYSQKGDRERAIADYLTALRLKPEDTIRKHVEAALKALGASATVVDRH